MRSGWNSSSESGFSPELMNLMGLPVTCLMESAPPPRASPSIFDMMTPSKSTRSAKAAATFTMSWPVMASTTMRIWSGFTAALDVFGLVHHLVVHRAGGPRCRR